MNYRNEDDWVKYLQQLENKQDPQCPPRLKDTPCSQCYLRGCCGATKEVKNA